MEDNIGCHERLYRTPIPLSYTRHTSRLLLVWLLYLPVALWAEFGLQSLLVAPLLVIALFGVEEIGIELEEPGGIMPSAWARRGRRLSLTLSPAVVALCEAIESQTLELFAIDAQVTRLATMKPGSAAPDS